MEYSHAVTRLKRDAHDDKGCGDSNSNNEFDESDHSKKDAVHCSQTDLDRNNESCSSPLLLNILTKHAFQETKHAFFNSGSLYSLYDVN